MRVRVRLLVEGLCAPLRGDSERDEDSSAAVGAVGGAMQPHLLEQRRHDMLRGQMAAQHVEDLP